MPRCLSVLAASIITLIPSFLTAQHLSQSDPRALAYAAQSMATLTGGVSIRDVTLTGTATWVAGSERETGAATLVGLGPNESHIELAFSSGTRTEIRDAQTGIARGKWTTPSGKSGKFAPHNCQTDAVWFFPALSSLAGGQNTIFTYLGQETRKGERVQHIRSEGQSSRTAATRPEPLSSIDFYLDAATLRPEAISFNVHPDKNMLDNIPVEVDFSDYQNVDGVMVPMHIEKYLQGSLLIDLTISNAAFNTGISLSTFMIE